MPTSQVSKRRQMRTPRPLLRWPRYLERGESYYLSSMTWLQERTHNPQSKALRSLEVEHRFEAIFEGKIQGLGREVAEHIGSIATPY